MSEGVVQVWLGDAAADRIREEIARAEGNEVCFVASVTEAGEMVEPQVVARGNASSVLAAIRSFEAGQVILHNHPSGELSPSHADLAVAERLWAEGLGFGIVDNSATRLYTVLEPAPPQEDEPLDTDQLEADLAPGGILSRAHPGYEDRPDQRALATSIARLYHGGGVGIAEAGTGIGKSVAYLLPAIRWAIQNRERTVVSTNTINLQEQLVRKDLPFLKRVLDVPIRFALVKGRSNYVSIRRARLAGINADSLFPDARETELQSILEWTEKTSDGSLSDLPFRPSPEVWDEVVSDSDVCLRARCPHFESCFYQRSRRDASSADILVVNHHLLFSDLAVRQAAGNYSAPAVLPHYQRLVLDEAHNLEETATRHLGARLTRRGFARMLRRLEHRGKGVLPSFEKALVGREGDGLAREALELVHQRLRPELESAWKRGSAVLKHAERIARGQAGGIVRLGPEFEDHPVWQDGLTEDLGAVIAHLDTLARGFALLRERLTMEEETAEALEEQLLEVRAASGRLEAAALAFGAALRGDTDTGETVRWIEYRSPPGSAQEMEGNVVLAAAPLDLAGVLRETLWERVPTAVLTSATLATRDGFGFLRERLGLDGEQEVEEAIYPSPFDFESQAVICIPPDAPIPSRDDDPAHARATERVVRDLAEVTDGGIFVLFTSYRALNHLANGLRRSGAAARWPLFVQGEAPRGQLLANFIESGRGILLGTDSFWEGVDVPGEPLRGLVIPKLPFKVPNEPVTAARIEALEAAGRNSFSEYMLPHAAIRLKQGFGRLIRSRMDRGAVVILDSRIVKRSYGRYLLESLPPARVEIASWRECLQTLRSFYENTRPDAAVRDSSTVTV